MDTPVNADATVRQIVTIEGTVFRADGRVEPLGVLARRHPNPLIRLLDRVRGVGRITNES